MYFSPPPGPAKANQSVPFAGRLKHSTSPERPPRTPLTQCSPSPVNGTPRNSPQDRQPMVNSQSSLFKCTLGDFKAGLQEGVAPPPQTLHTHGRIGNNHDSEQLRQICSFIRSDFEDFSQRWSAALAQQSQNVISRQEELFKGNFYRCEELLQGSISRQEKLLQCFAEERALIVRPSEHSAKFDASVETTSSAHAKLGASVDMTSQTMSSASAKRVEKELQETATKSCVDAGHLDEAQASQVEPEMTEDEPEPASPRSIGSHTPNFMDRPTGISDIKPSWKTGNSVAELIKMEIASKRRTSKISKASHDGDSGFVSVASMTEYVMRAMRSDHFEHMSCVITFLNVLFYGVEVHVMATQHTSQKHLDLTLITILFSMYFGCELTMRIVANHRSFLFGEDKWWNLVDVIIVLASVTDISLKFLMTNNNFFRFAQIFGMFRLFRIIRAFRFLQDLKTLIHSILSTMQQMFWTIALIFILLYLFGIIFTEATTASGFRLLAEQGAWPCNENDTNEEPCLLQNLYGDLFTSMLTLYMSITGGMDWSDAFNPLQADVGPIFAALFVFFVTSTTLTVMNVAAIFCQSAIEGAANQRELKMQKFKEQQELHLRQLGDVFKAIDMDGSGDLTLDEFEIGVMNPGVQTFFESMELSIQEARLLFNLLRSDEDNALDMDDFVEGCLQLCGRARNFDVALLRYECRNLSNNVHELLETSKEYRKRTLLAGPSKTRQECQRGNNELEELAVTRGPRRLHNCSRHASAVADTAAALAQNYLVSFV